MKLALLSSALGVALLAAAPAFASPTALPAGMSAVPLAAITNDRDASVSNIDLMVDAQSNVRGIYLATRANKQASPADAKGQVFWLPQIEKGDGVVLGKGGGVKAILLSGTIQPTGGHGALVIKYVTNGIFRHYSECQVNLQRVGPDHWQMVNAYDGQPVSHIEVKTWALGISTLTNVCPTRAA